MRHQKAGAKLNRDIHQRKALFKSLIQSLILKEEIKTTEAKAKAIKGLIDKLIFKARAGSLHVRRQIMAFLPDKKAANKLVDDIAKRFSQRHGGFTKLVRLGKRRGDNAMIVKMELVKKIKPVIAKVDKKAAKTVANTDQKQPRKKLKLPILSKKS
jgi:large subunit ribosomal protein L17